MKYIKLVESNAMDALKEAVHVLKDGGIIAYPTETFYALGAKFDHAPALKRLSELKGRPANMAFPLIIGGSNTLKLVATAIHKASFELAKKHWPGPLTILAHAVPGLPPEIVQDDRVAVRMPGESFALRLMQYANFPITTTSANISGKPAAHDAMTVGAYFGAKVDLIIDGGKTPGGEPSTIIESDDRGIRIIRQGAIKIDLT